MLDIKLERAAALKTKPAVGQPLGFGHLFTDHMFVMNYTEGKGWHDPRIVPFSNLSLSPAAMVFHYGQEMFEGLKAYRSADGHTYLFRPDMNAKRAIQSNDRLCIPHVDEEFAIEALRQLILVDKEWIPNVPGTSLYIRPFIIATEPYLGVKASDRYIFMIILSPVGAYYPEGLNPVKIAVESDYVRAVKGGTGNAKTAGNYAASLKAQSEAEADGYTQVLWLDGKENKYIEEVGSMNVFFKINGEVITPKLNGSILAGITRKSVIELLEYWNIPVKEKKISIDELIEAHQSGELEEAFGTGTAAVISPIGELYKDNKPYVINNGQTGELSKRVYDEITGIQTGEKADPFNWRYIVK